MGTACVSVRRCASSPRPFHGTGSNFVSAAFHNNCWANLILVRWAPIIITIKRKSNLKKYCSSNKNWQMRDIMRLYTVETCAGGKAWCFRYARSLRRLPLFLVLAAQPPNNPHCIRVAVESDRCPLQYAARIFVWRE
jgi:hypothetical protein